MAKNGFWKKILIGIAVLAIIAALGMFLFSGDNAGIIKNLFDGNTDAFIEGVQNLGIRGVIVLAVLSMLQVLLPFMPAEPAQVLAGMCNGFWAGIGICVMGVFVGNTIIYLMYRVFGAKMDKYFKKNITVDFDVLRESKRVVLLIFILYFLPAIPYGLICLFTCTVNKNYFRYIIITMFGSVPSIMIGVALGRVAITSSWIVSVSLFVVIVVLLVLLYVNRSKVFKKINEFAVKQFGYSSNTQVRKPNGFISWWVWLAFKMWLGSNVKTEIKNEVKKVEGPAIILCNHGSFIDFLYLSTVLKSEKPHVVSGRQYFYGKKLGNLLKKMGCIPKSMFSTDIESTRNCLKVIKDNGVLVVFPEARLSTAGKFEDIQEGTEKFLQKMNANIYVLKFSGDYLAMPKWAKHKNKRRVNKKSTVEAHFYQLYKQGEPMKVPAEQFEKTIHDAIVYNDFQWLETRPELTYKSKYLAEGLENILYRCPHCGKLLTLTTKGRTVSCSDCGYTATLNDRYGFENGEPFGNFQQWYDWQNEQMRQEILSDNDFRLTSRVKLFHQSPSGRTQLVEVGDGVCTLNRDGLTYVGTDGEKQITKHFPLNQIYRLLFGAGEDFEIYEGEKFWYFVPDDKRGCVMWYVASILLKEVAEKQVQPSLASEEQ